MGRTDNIDLIINSIASKNTSVSLSGTFKSLNTLFKEAIERDPRILAFLGGYNGQYQSKYGFKTYNITITYNDDIPNRLDDVIVDDGTYSLHSLSKIEYPHKLYFVTDDMQSFVNRMSQEFTDLFAYYEGMYGMEKSYFGFQDLSNKCAVILTFNYGLEPMMLNSKMNQAHIKALQIANDLLKNQRVPDYVKVFLALSYIQQETMYDHIAYNRIIQDASAIINDPMPSIAYGPLLENRGICSGVSYAMKYLLDALNVENELIFGALKGNDGKYVEHQWNLVKLGNFYYHVDATYGIDQPVYVGSLFLHDNAMKEYRWDPTLFPKAIGRKYDYEEVEDWLVDHGEDLVDAGVDEKYVFPEHLFD